DVFRTLNPTDPGYSFGHQYTPQESRIDYIITNQFFENMLVNSTVGDTEHAFTGADHYTVDVFLNWTGRMNATALGFDYDETPITDLNHGLSIINQELSEESFSFLTNQIDAGASDRTMASVLTKVSTLALVKTRGGLIFSTLL
ncbi:MAG: hypothetical protein ACFFEL_14990, partial [Candidatus Thorarchaeota archaeon]